MVDESDYEKVKPYVAVASVVYPTLLIITSLAHSVLLVFIIFFSPSKIGFLRCLLFITSFLDVLVTFILCFLQPRIVSGHYSSVPVFVYGLCQYFNPHFCFTLYMFWQTLSIGVGSSLTYTLFFKYHQIRGKGPLRGIRFISATLFFYWPCFVSMICAIVISLKNTIPDGGEETRKECRLMGRMMLGELPNRINFGMILAGIYICPVVAFFLRRTSTNYINSAMAAASPALQYQTKNVMKGLTIQVTLHFLFYIPVFTLYFYSLVFGSEFLFQQFFQAMSPNLAATIDPIINLYYVIPYRNRIKSWFRIFRTQNSAVQVTPARSARSPVPPIFTSQI